MIIFLVGDHFYNIFDGVGNFFYGFLQVSVSAIQGYSFDIGLVGDVDIHFIEEVVGGGGKGSEMFSSFDGLL